jgi:hypothetical protein
MDPFAPDVISGPAAQAALLRGQMPGNRAQMIQRQQQELAQAQQAQEAAYQPIDRAPMEQAYQQRAQSGGTQLLAALAAQQAGAGFEPFQAHYLKQAAASRAPMQMDGGTMTEQGFIEDPNHARNLNIRRADAKAANLERALQGSITAEEGERLKKELQKTQQDFQREMQKSQQAQSSMLAGQASADRRYAADLAHTDRAAAAAAKTAAAPKTTEDERKAAGWYTNAVRSYETVKDILAKDPTVDQVGLAEGAASMLPQSMARGATQMARSPSRQVYANAVDVMNGAFLRAATGAGYSLEEGRDQAARIIPQFGDAPELRKQKMDNFPGELEALAARAGRALPADTPKPGLAPAPGGKRLRFNPATGALE